MRSIRRTQCTAIASGMLALLAILATSRGSPVSYRALPDPLLARVAGLDTSSGPEHIFSCADVNLDDQEVPGYKCDDDSLGEICIQCDANANALQKTGKGSGSVRAMPDPASCKGDKRRGHCQRDIGGMIYCSYTLDVIPNGCQNDTETHPDQ